MTKKRGKVLIYGPIFNLALRSGPLKDLNKTWYGFWSIDFMENLLLQADRTVQFHGAHLGPPLINAAPFKLLSPHDQAHAQFYAHPTFVNHWIESQEKIYGYTLKGC